MSVCSTCGEKPHRVRRTLMQRLAYSEVTRCPACGERQARLHPSISSVVMFVFSRRTRCIECGTHRVRRVAKLDRVDHLSKSPFSWTFRLTGGQLHKCDACRLQYYDWRPKLSD